MAKTAETQMAQASVGRIAMGLVQSMSPLLALSDGLPEDPWTVTVAHGGASITVTVHLRDGYTGAALDYYEQRRRLCVARHGEDRVAEWESVIEDHLASRTGHLPPLEALLLMSDVYGQGQWHEKQHHA